MIVPMRKVSVVVLDSDRENALARLRDLGVLHLQLSHGRSPELDSLEENQALLGRAITALPDPVDGSEDSGRHAEKDGLILAEAVLELRERDRGLQEEKDRLTRELDSLLPWGEFDPDDIRALAEKSVSIRLFVLNKDQYNTLKADPAVFVIRREKNLFRVAVIGDSEAVEDLEAVPLPDRGATAVRAAIEEVVRTRDGIAGSLESLAARRGVLVDELERISGEVVYEQARISMEGDEALAHISGYVPTDEQPGLT